MYDAAPRVHQAPDIQTASQQHADRSEPVARVRLIDNQVTGASFSYDAVRYMKNLSRVASLFIGPLGLRAGWGLLIFAATATSLAYLLFIVLPPNQLFGPSVSRELKIFIGEGKLLIIVFCSTAVMAWMEGRGIWSYGMGGSAKLKKLWGAHRGELRY